MDQTIQNILQQHSTNAVLHSHVSMGSVKGKYAFSRQGLEEFWKVYMETINGYPETCVGIAEKPQHYLPVLGDIDIKIMEDEKSNIGDIIHTDQHVKDVVEIYQSVLRKIVENCTDKHLICIVLEKPLYRINKNGISYAKHGFHLHFPYCFLDKMSQEVHLIPRVQELVKECKVFEDIGFEDSSKLIDKSCCTVPWLLYGARKQSDMEPYRVTKVYNSEVTEISLEKALKRYKIYDMNEDLIPIKGKVKEYLPRILSIIPYNRTNAELRQGLVSPLKEKIRERKRESKEHKTLSIIQSLEIAKNLLPLLDISRAEDRTEWLTVGWALFNSCEGCPEALDLWCEFSSRAVEKYDESVCIYQWEKMVKKDLTIGTIKYYASIDSPEKYKEYQDQQANKHIQEALSGSHNDIAKVLYEKYGNEFVCVSIQSRGWYQFNNHRWEEIEDGIFLREKISEEIVRKFAKMGQELYEKMGNVEDKGIQAMYKTRLNCVEKMKEKLKSAPFKNNCMREACEVFYDRRFREKLDTNPALFPFKNGVYDLNLNIFRAGRPEDFISKTAAIDYDPTLTEDNSKVQDVYDFLEKVFPDKSVRKYFMDVSSDIFYGGNHQKQVYFWTGEGDNAKSVTQGLFEKMLGKLSIKFNTTVITGKKVQSGAANPELARAGGGVRMATLEEPNSDEMINVGILKNLSGNDSYYARDLFEKGKEGREIVPMFKLIFICLSKGTAVSLASGISVSIEKLTQNHQLLSWDDKTGGLIRTNQQKLINNGEQDCVTLTLFDGREITCTPNHKFLTSKNEWVEAKDITIGDHSLKMGIDNPKCDDVFDNHDYIFKVGDLHFDFNNYTDRLKASALCRLIGYVITDGSGNKVLYMGHLIDCEGVLEDIYLLTGKRPVITKNKNTFHINIPTEVSKEISKIIPDKKGRKVNQPICLPDFMFDKQCPTFLIREMIAGMFGGDGVLPSIVKNQCTMIQLVASKEEKHVQSLVDMFGKMSTMMKERFGIESIVSEPKYYENYHTDLSGKDKFNVFLRICRNEDMLKFIEKIGVRYCCHKSYRLMTVSSILRYKKTVVKQNQAIIDRTRELLDKYKRQNVKPLVVQLTKTGAYVATYKSTQEAQHITGIHHSRIRSSIKRNGTSGGFKWINEEQGSEVLDEEGCETIKEAYEKAKKEIKENMGISGDDNIVTYSQIRSYYLVYENNYKLPWINIEKYLKDTGLEEFCNNQNGTNDHNYSVNIERTTLPCYNMLVINRRDAGKNHVYDLNVEEPYSNFIAEGIVTHNCNKLPKLRGSDQASWNRIRVIPFESTFCRSDDPAPKSYEEQLRQKRFPMDKEFSQKIPGMLQAFAWVLLEHRKHITTRVEPEKVRMATAIYRKENDIYRQFVEECIAEDSEKYLSLIELYAQFKEWFRDSLPNHTLPIKNQVEEYFIKVWDTPERGKKWKGYRIRTMQDDIEEGEVVILEEEDLVNYDEVCDNLPPM